MTIKLAGITLYWFSVSKVDGFYLLAVVVSIFGKGEPTDG